MSENPWYNVPYIPESKETRDDSRAILQEERSAMRQAFIDVLNFHKKFRPHLIGDVPNFPDNETCDFRERLIEEEYKELMCAMEYNDMHGIADAMADLIYVIIGASVTYGIDLTPIWHEVHSKNMQKQINKSRPDGKVTKPEEWTPPDIKGILYIQKPLKEIYGE